MPHHRRCLPWLLMLLLLAACAAVTPRDPAAPSPSPTSSPTASQTAVPSVTRTRAARAPAARTPAARALTRTPTRTATRTPVPTRRTPTRTPTLPPQAQVTSIYGYGQLLALSCEARAAADWARHFGITIHELDFLSRLPHSKNPEMGFVGSVNGDWGQIPPASYGVHAGPIAEVLHSYGAKAEAVRHFRLDQLKAEIAAGRPVIVWVTGHVAPGKGVAYKVDDETTVTVAAYEHTVIVTGYDEKKITILDGKTVYQRDTETFLKAWAPLENMAIIWNANVRP